jgi:hypothetical protein
MKKFLGKGMFSTAYLLDSGMVEIHSSCNAKEGLTVFGNDNLHLPKIERIAERIYLMPYYRTACTYSTLCTEDAKDLRTIRKAIDNKYRYDNSGYIGMSLFVSKLDIQDSLKEALEHLCCIMGNYHNQIGLEFYNRNMKVENGRLILLDVAYSLENYKWSYGRWILK